MRTSKITFSIEISLLKKIDLLVRERFFSNGGQAIQCAIEEKISRMHTNRLARECAKLDKKEEQEMADLGLVEFFK